MIKPRTILQDGFERIRPRGFVLLESTSRRLATVTSWMVQSLDRVAHDLVCAAVGTVDHQLRLVVDEQVPRIPGLLEDSELRYVLDELLPTRIDTLQRHLILRETKQARHLLEFLPVVHGVAAAGAREASDPEDVADAVSRALDDLHSYVLAHELVGLGYRFELHVDDLPYVPPAWRRAVGSQSQRPAARSSAWAQGPTSFDLAGQH